MGVISPIRLIFWSFLIWLFFFIQMPVRYMYDGSALFPVFTLVVFILCFITGFHSLKKSKVKIIEDSSEKKIKQIVFILFWIGLIGVLLKVYIGFFKSDIFIAEDVFEQRLENMGKEFSGGAIGVIASILFPFSFVSLLIAIYNFKLFNKLSLLFIGLAGIYPMVETLFMGGRTTIALLGTSMIFVIYASFHKNSNLPLFKLKLGNIKLIAFPKFLLKKIVIFPLLLIGILFTTYSIEVVNKRLTRFGYGDRTFKVWEQKDYQWLKFDEDYKIAYFNSSKDDKAKMIGYHNLKHYFVHGVVEYIRLINHLDNTTGYYYGQYEFNVFFKFFRTFGIPLKSLDELNVIVDRKAVYQTFWGPFYIDFGVFGFIIMFFWGRFVKRIYTHAKRGSTAHLIFYGYLATILITSAFLNFLLGSSSYYLFAFFVTLFVFKYWSNNMVFKLK